ncbi:MAG: HPr family phosphocarrier protein, partial [Anaerohalosphaera sp.]|nr:HPr family phosphocarrier protein [Anaerohalosphaera sp.]
KHVLPCRCRTPDACSDYATCETSEESLRSLELKFHNLQSLYDTYVSKTETEGLDTDLPVLRGHISVVFHLLRIATEFAHYYERHVINKPFESSDSDRKLVDADALLSRLTNYAISYASQFLNCAERLCQEMLKKYAEIGRIDVLVPQYRGFHVRPSTLIAKLVLHYGSNVTMLLGDETYDAGSPLELFRANEKINAMKRIALAKDIVKLKLVPDSADGHDVETIIRNVFMNLADRSRLVLYERPLQLQCLSLCQDAILFEQVSDAVAKLLATGQIDIVTDMQVTFVGDKRVLNDIKLLAETGYGEDHHGNNIPLAEELRYLRK